jgi:integral membrane protein 2B
VDLEAAAQARPQYFILKARARRVSTATTVCLFLAALLVMGIGIIGGAYLYRQFARSQVSRHVCCLFVAWHIIILVMSVTEVCFD